MFRAPFHCDIMAPAAKALKEEFEKIKPFYPPTMITLSNATACPIECHLDISDTLTKQAVSQARWLESMEYLKDHGVKRWLCMGPGTVIANIVRREYPNMIVRYVDHHFPVQNIPKIALFLLYCENPLSLLM